VIPVSAPYDAIGPHYDRTRRADPNIAAALHRHLKPTAGGRYLDLACGTGNYSIALAGAGLAVCGVDRSEAMIGAARRKAPAIPWWVAGADALPFAAGVFDGAVCTLAIHHFADFGVVFSEVHRVMGPGRFVIFTSSPDQMRQYWLIHYFPTALERSIAQMPDPRDVEEALAGAGFRTIAAEPFFVPDDLADLFLYSGKIRPALYLDPDVRAGISTFFSLADAEEVRDGLARLQADLSSGAIEDVVRSFDDAGGDYLFITAERCD
jgi:ubiquinone/menaquinone biosynthesis C-methylase UbiE